LAILLVVVLVVTVGNLLGCGVGCNCWQSSWSLLHIVPFCEGPNEKLEGFAKQKQKT